MNQKEKLCVSYSVHISVTLTWLISSYTDYIEQKADPHNLD